MCVYDVSENIFDDRYYYKISYMPTIYISSDRHNKTLIKNVDYFFKDKELFQFELCLKYYNNSISMLNNVSELYITEPEIMNSIYDYEDYLRNLLCEYLTSKYNYNILFEKDNIEIEFQENIDVGIGIPFLCPVVINIKVPKNDLYLAKLLNMGYDVENYI